jgi:hypothetical protein
VAEALHSLPAFGPLHRRHRGLSLLRR